MRDIYNSWNQGESNETLNVRKDTFMDVLHRFLWDKVATDETRRELFGLKDAKELFNRMLDTRPTSEQFEDTCALTVEKENGQYIIKMVLMDKNRNLVRVTSKSYCGYVIRAKHIDEMLYRYMNGQTLRIMQNPNL